MSAGLNIDSICRILAARPPRLSVQQDVGRAAVAVILHAAPGSEASVLIIERTRRTGDPWSGHLAFPGGHLEATDADERAAAERETHEEIGLDLSSCRCLGRLDDRTARVRPLTVSAFVYSIDEPPEFVLSEEVAQTFWIPLTMIVDRGRQCQHEGFPAVELLGPGHPLLWGVTYHFLCMLLHGLGHELPLTASA